MALLEKTSSQRIIRSKSLKIKSLTPKALGTICVILFVIFSFPAFFKGLPHLNRKYSANATSNSHRNFLASKNLYGGNSWSKNHSVKLQPRLLIVTYIPPSCFFGGEDGKRTAQIIKNRIDYGKLQNIDVLIELNDIDPTLDHSWNKILLLLKIMAGKKRYDWIWYLDHQSLITDFSYSIPWEKYRDFSLVLSPGQYWELFNKPNKNCINTGLFLIQNCRWSRSLLERMYDTYKEAVNYNSDTWGYVRNTIPNVIHINDQIIMTYMLFQEKERTKLRLYMETINFGGMKGAWKSQMKLLEENKIDARSTHNGVVPPAVIHFNDCDMCSSDQMLATCKEEFQKCYHYADNQGLELIKLRHSSLSSSKLQDLPQLGMD